LVESLELPLVANYIQQNSAAEHSTSYLSSGAVACGEAIKNMGEKSSPPKPREPATQPQATGAEAFKEYEIRRN
jgi:hypothetical protein